MRNQDQTMLRIHHAACKRFYYVARAARLAERERVQAHAGRAVEIVEDVDGAEESRTMLLTGIQ